MNIKKFEYDKDYKRILEERLEKLFKEWQIEHIHDEKYQELFIRQLNEII